MPYYWDAIKTVFLVWDKEDEWHEMAKRIFPQRVALIDADWGEWRRLEGVTIV